MRARGCGKRKGDKEGVVKSRLLREGASAWDVAVACLHEPALIDGLGHAGRRQGHDQDRRCEARADLPNWDRASMGTRPARHCSALLSSRRWKSSSTHDDARTRSLPPLVGPLAEVGEQEPEAERGEARRRDHVENDLSCSGAGMVFTRRVSEWSAGRPHSRLHAQVHERARVVRARRANSAICVRSRLIRARAVSPG